ncbi:MAG TPA: MnhB domain-containing protein, partial [Gaiellales bacterium]|nr:MnhB domain-containing protein [Gaiellales bacterium]
LAAGIAWGCTGARPFGDFAGRYGLLLNSIAVPQRHATNVVTATVFDYRGFDTLGEEFILFASVIGVVLLLRDERDPPRRGRLDAVESDAIRLFGVVMVGLTVLVGAWLAAFGLVTPGGGFQGGVAIAAGFVLVFLTAGYRPWRMFGREHLLDPFEGAGAATYVAVGLAALISGAPFLKNLLGPGEAGTLLSGGSMSILNWAVAVEVAAANLVLYTEFLESYLVPHLE